MSDLLKRVLANRVANRDTPNVPTPKIGGMSIFDALRLMTGDQAAIPEMEGQMAASQGLPYIDPSQEGDLPDEFEGNPEAMNDPRIVESMNTLLKRRGKQMEGPLIGMSAADPEGRDMKTLLQEFLADAMSEGPGVVEDLRKQGPKKMGERIERYKTTGDSKKEEKKRGRKKKPASGKKNEPKSYTREYGTKDYF